MKHLIVIIYTLLLLVAQASANNNNYSFRSLSINNGLSHATATSILSDHNEQIWIGTAFGLNRYNGQKIKNYFHKREVPTSLPNSYILFITEDSMNNIWVSTMQGLVRYNPQNDNFLPPVPGQKIQVHSFCHTPHGVLFGGNNTLYLFDTKKNTFSTLLIPELQSTSNTQINFIREWKKEVYLLFFSNGEIKEYHLASRKISPSVFTGKTNEITAIYIDNAQNLYISSYRKGIIILDKNGKLKYHIHTGNSPLTYNAILDIKEKDQKLWIATDGRGINIMDMKNPFNITSIQHSPGNKNSLPANSICCLYKDSRNNMWAGSIREGAFEIKKVFIHTYQDVLPDNKYGLSNKTVISLCQDRQGAMWIGTDGGGVNKFNPDNQTFVQYPSTYNKKVTSIVDYSATKLLVIFYLDGSYLFDKQSGQCTPYIQPAFQNNSPNRIYKIANNRILFLSDRPYIYNTDTRQSHFLKTKESPNLTANLRLIGITGNHIYLISNNNFAKIDIKTDSLYSFFSVEKEEIVQTASYDPSGLFWIGTDQGLYRLELKTMKYKKIETNLFDRVSTIVSENEHRLWIGAQNILYSYNPKENKFIIWDETDGFSPNELIEIYQPPTYNRYMYFGGIHGLVQIDKSIKSYELPTHGIMLADVILDGVSAFPSQNIKKSVFQLSIPWDYKLLQLKVLALDKDIFKKRLFKFHIFKYAIKSSEIQTSESYNSTLSLNMLSPGEYSIYVSYYTDNGTWSPQKEILHLNVATPWYKDYRILLGIFILFCIFLYWRILVYIRTKEGKMKWKMNEIIQKHNQERINTLINISHELRTPLTLIYAPLKKMLENANTLTSSPQEQTYLKKQLTSIHKSANQMKTIINMTLEISRIESKGDTLQIAPHIINEWIRSVGEEFEYEMEAKDIVIDYRLDENITLVDFDNNKCESVLSNLLMNALKFSPAHSQITISSQLVEGFIRISVSDQGIGLNNLDPEQLFNRFYQGEHNRHGSGIGLSYSKILIQKHGGNIGAYNNSIQGATFFFELPLQQTCTANVQNSTETVIPNLDAPLIINFPEEVEFATHNYSLIIVEDNNELQEFLQETFKNEFQTIYTASDGEEALQIINDKMPDIIVSDIMMPKMDGYTLCQQIKSSILTSHIPIVLLTARCDTDSTMAGYKIGADAYVPKPFEVEFLQTILRNLLLNREALKKRYRESFIHIPTGEAPLQTTNSDEEFLVKLNKLISENLSSKEINVKYLTDQMGMSRTPLYNKLKALTNMGVNDYINQLRIEKAAMLLTQTSLSIIEISEEVGFEYQKYFSTLFKQIKGVTPTQYRRQEISKQGNKDN